MTRDRPASVIEAIAGWCDAAAPFSSNAREHAVHAIIDTLACMVAGRTDPSARAVRDTFARGDAARGACRVVDGAMADAGAAALINGTAAHALDFDDNFRPGMSHASAVLVPALLAVADLTESGGAHFMHAYLVGLQAQAFVGACVGQAHYAAGWHGTSTVGCIGTAAGTAKLLGLDQEGIARALSVAVSMASGIKGQFGTPVKPFHAGMAARNAVEAALLARAGMRGRMDILEGPQGFQELFAGDHSLRWDFSATETFDAHIIETDGVIPKRHPCCGSTHLIVDALLDLMAEADIDAEDIDQISTVVGIANYRNLAYPRPRNEMEARFSMQYCVARALRKGVLELDDFTPDAIVRFGGDPLLSRISMRHHSEETGRGSDERPPHRLAVKLKDGRIFERARRFARGTLDEPFSEQDRLAKFFDCCKELDEPASVYSAFCELESATTLRCLAPVFQVGSRTAESAAAVV